MKSAGRSERRERFARTLRELREAKNFSRREVAEKALLHVSAVEKLEAGQHSPELDTLYRLAGALGVGPSSFFDGLSWEPNPSGGGSYRIVEDEG